MKNKIRNILIIVFIPLLVSNCGEEFLTIDPVAMELSNSFLNAEENAVRSINAAYSVLNGRQGYSRNYWVFADVASDDAECGGEAGGGDQPDAQNIGKLTHNSSNSYFREFWGALYQGIYRANFVVSELPKSTLENRDLVNRLVAEGRFLRCKYHFDLVKVFGAVPLINRILSPEEYKQTRASIAEVLHFIEDDLEEAAKYLPDFYSNPDDNGRVTKAAAIALRAKVMLFESSYADLASSGKDINGEYEGCENKWEEVKQLSEQLISDAGKYKIGLEKNWKGLWRVTGENSEEHVFKINCASITAYSGEDISNGVPGNFYGVGSVGNIYMKCRSYVDLGNPFEEAFVEALDGWGFNCPTQDLVDAFNPADPRLKGSVLSDGDTIVIDREGNVGLAWPSYTSPTGYAQLKYSVLPAEYTEGARTHGGPLDGKVIRFADVVLWAAESNFKTGNTSRATELVNMVRKRAREMVTPASAEPADLGTVTLEDIYKERRLELCMEHHRFFDLVRTGRAASKLNGFYSNSLPGNLVFEAGKHEHFPIPTSSITQSDNKLEQNPGY